MATDAGRGTMAQAGKLIRLARVERGWNQRTLAERMGVSVATISDLENGHRDRMSRGTVLALEEALGLTDRRLSRLLGLLPESPPARRSLSYGGQQLTAEQEQQVIDYIDWVRSRDQAS